MRYKRREAILFIFMAKYGLMALPSSIGTITQVTLNIDV